MWTHFWDMHSGGGCKEPPYENIFIEAPEDEACAVFYNRFGHNPDRVSCTCCGPDYSVSCDYDTLEEATGFQRNCKYDDTGDGFVFPEEKGDSYRDYIPLGEYMQRPDILIIFASGIKPEERTADIPAQGYVYLP